MLLTLPYSFSQLGMLSGIMFQLFYGLLGSWTAYLISILYVEYRTRKEREKVDFRNHVIQVLYPTLLYFSRNTISFFFYLKSFQLSLVNVLMIFFLEWNQMIYSGLKFLMDSLENIGGMWVWHLTALFFCLDLSFN